MRKLIAAAVLASLPLGTALAQAPAPPAKYVPIVLDETHLAVLLQWSRSTLPPVFQQALMTWLQEQEADAQKAAAAEPKPAPTQPAPETPPEPAAPPK